MLHSTLITERSAFIQNPPLYIGITSPKNLPLSVRQLRVARAKGLGLLIHRRQSFSDQKFWLEQLPVLMENCAKAQVPFSINHSSNSCNSHNDSHSDNNSNDSSSQIYQVSQTNERCTATHRHYASDYASDYAREHASDYAREHASDYASHGTKVHQPNLVLRGASCHSSEELQRISSVWQPDYLLLSPVQATDTHPEATLLSWDGLADLAGEVALLGSLVYALGGMDQTDVARARSCGAAGLAGIGLVNQLTQI